MLVYLDSNVYIDADYVFDREEFLTLRDLMRKGKLQKKGSFWWEFFEKLWIRIIPLRPMLTKIYTYITR